MLAEPLFLPSCFPHSIPPSLWPLKKSTQNAMSLKVGTADVRGLQQFLSAPIRAIRGFPV